MSDEKKLKSQQFEMTPGKVDAPTLAEFEELKQRVGRLEHAVLPRDPGEDFDPVKPTGWGHKDRQP